MVKIILEYSLSQKSYPAKQGTLQKFGIRYSAWLSGGRIGKNFYHEPTRKEDLAQRHGVHGEGRR